VIDHEAYHLALRARARTLTVCTTGSTTLSATSAGYARTTGSFLTDGFRPGMQLLAAGFAKSANNGRRVITAVSALAIECAGCSGEGAASGRTISVGLPIADGDVEALWENVEFTPTTGVPWTEERYIPGPAPRKVELGEDGEVELRPMYELRIHFPENKAARAVAKYTDAICNHFAHPYYATLGSGDLLRARTDVMPFRGELRPSRPGWVSVAVTLPFWIRTTTS
jgi:hypothetical protein